MGIFKKLFSRKSKENNKKYELGLHKSRQTFASLNNLLKESSEINDDLFYAIEDIFIQADIGVDTVLYFTDVLRKTVETNKISNPNDLKEIIVDKLFELYLKEEFIDSNLKYEENEINVYLFVGVNGVGKTTTIGKIANKFKKENKKVLLVAADTFRAGAINQLKIWAERSKSDFYAKEENSDPSSVCYEALELAKQKKYDVVLIDTAGRLQNKVGLMNELAKIKRTCDKVIPNTPQETLLVLDATTGQNGLKQAEVFQEVTNVSGIILTKLDGTAKGGIVLAIRHLYNLVIKYVGLGEQLDDLVPFDIEEYLRGIFGDFFENEE